MAHLKTEEVTCRNCGHKQDFQIWNGKLPSLTEAVDVCKSCGFKSIWYTPLPLLSDEVLEKLRKDLAKPKDSK